MTERNNSSVDITTSFELDWPNLTSFMKAQFSVVKALRQMPLIFPYEIKRRINQDYILVAFLGDSPLDQIPRELVLAESLGTSRFEVKWTDEENREVMLEMINGSSDTIIDRGFVTGAEKNADIQLKLDRLNEIIGQLESRDGRTTGNRIIDFIFRLKKSALENINTHEASPRADIDSQKLTLIEGPPGSGKTTLITQFIEQAVREGKKVLLVSQMHVAVDNVLSRLRNKRRLPILRLGNNPLDLHHQMQKYWPGNRERELRYWVLNEFMRKYRENKNGGLVIAGTNIGVATNLVLRKPPIKFLTESGFDLLIMDEANAEVVSGALVPLNLLREEGSTIFAGDRRQLKPFGLTIEEKKYLIEKAGVSEAAIAAYNTSIFDLLVKIHGSHLITLRKNYRSLQEIVNVISHLFYGGSIEPARIEEAESVLMMVDIGKESEVYYEKNVGSSYQNPASAQEVIKVVGQYCRMGIKPDQISIIAPYRAQVSLLKQLLQEVEAVFDDLPTVTTVEGYQGRENGVIILDLVRSNPNGEIGFLRNLNRLNVALSGQETELQLSGTLEHSPRNDLRMTAKSLLQNKPLVN